MITTILLTTCLVLLAAMAAWYMIKSNRLADLLLDRQNTINKLREELEFKNQQTTELLRRLTNTQDHE